MVQMMDEASGIYKGSGVRVRAADDGRGQASGVFGILGFRI